MSDRFLQKHYLENRNDKGQGGRGIGNLTEDIFYLNLEIYSQFIQRKSMMDASRKCSLRYKLQTIKNWRNVEKIEAIYNGK